MIGRKLAVLSLGTVKTCSAFSAIILAENPKELAVFDHQDNLLLGCRHNHRHHNDENEYDENDDDDDGNKRGTIGCR